MNAFAIIILAALIIEFVIELVGNLLNLKALNLELPSGLQGIYQPEDYRKSQEYLRATTRFGLVEISIPLIILLIFWFAGGFNYVDQLIRKLNFAPLITGLLYIGILLLAYSLLKLPFNIYDTFVIEKRFGFNRTTPAMFFGDKLKGLGLVLVLGGLLLAGILWLFQNAGNYAWLFCWAAVIIFSLTLQYIAPTWIMPLFNKFKPLEAGELKEAIFAYSRSVNFPIKNIYVIDGSKRSSKSNAFFTGFGKNKRIALFDTLIAQHTVAEIVAVLAHEVGHYKKKHILQATLISILYTGIIFFLLSLILGNRDIYQAFYMKQESIYAGLIFFSLLYTPINLVLSIVMQMLSRKNEYEADRFAAETLDQPDNLIESLKKLSSKNLANLNPHPFYVLLNYSHPPLLKRIQTIHNTINK